MKNLRQVCRGIPATAILLWGTLLLAPMLRAEETDYLKRLAVMTDPRTLAESEPDEVARVFVRSLVTMEILRAQVLEPAEAVESALLRNGTDSLRRELVSRHLRLEYSRFAERGEWDVRVARLIPLEEKPELGREVLNYVLSGDLKPGVPRIEQAREALRDARKYAPALEEVADQLRHQHRKALAFERQTRDEFWADQVAEDREIASRRERRRQRFARALNQRQTWEQRDGWTLRTIMDEQRRIYHSPAYSYCYPRAYPIYPAPPPKYDEGLKTRPAGIYKAPLGLKNEEPIRGSYIRVD